MSSVVWDVLGLVGSGAMEQCLEGQNGYKSFLEAKAPFCFLLHDRDIINSIIRILFALPLRPLHGS